MFGRSIVAGVLIAVACGGETLRERDAEPSGPSDAGSGGTGAEPGPGNAAGTGASSAAGGRSSESTAGQSGDAEAGSGGEAGDAPFELPACPPVMELEEFEDYRVARGVRAELGDGPLGVERRAELKVVQVEDAKSLMDLRCFPELRELVVETSVGREGRALDITGLSALKKLERLVIADSVPTDMAPLGALEGLSELTLSGVGEIDIGLFENLPELVYLLLFKSQLNNLSRLVNLKKLTGLALSNVGLEEIPPLPPGVVEINLMFNQIVDPSGINALPSRRVVYLNHNAISDLTSLAEGPPSYGLLDITGNPIDCELQHDNLAILVEWGALTDCQL